MTTGSIACVVLALQALAACGTSGRAAAEPASSPPAPRPPVHGNPVWRDLLVCVMEDGMPREVQVRYNLMTGDSVIDGRPFAEAYPVTAAFAADKEWYVQNELVVLDGRRFVKYGRTRILRPGRAVPLGTTYRGVPLYTEAGDDAFPSAVLYVPVRPGCEFQSYQWDLVTGGVRG